MSSNKRPVIAITGASGYIGSHLMERLKQDANIVALSRNIKRKTNRSNITWRACDLFSRTDAIESLQGADYAVYLVHSMKPKARLTQAKFEDMDVILADNFAQAAKKAGVKQIIYLSGIIPEQIPKRNLSRHLKSRLEIESILRHYGVPVTSIRSGLIVGPGGSSFPIAKKLVQRLPIMTLPKWTRTKTHPIALDDVLLAIEKSIGCEEIQNESLDIGGPETMSYVEMMRQIADIMGKKRIFIPLPLLTVKLSRLWISTITRTSPAMAYPLIESLIHPMVANESRMKKGISYGRVSFKEAVTSSLNEDTRRHSVKMPSLSLPSVAKDVRSIQRMHIPEGMNAQWVADCYIEWLAKLGKPFLRSNIEAHGKVIIAIHRLKLLELSFEESSSSKNRALYSISGGIFTNTATNRRGRIEFRTLPLSSECIVAIHDYMPSLPWFLYKYTQAKVHMLVMYLFSRQLKKLIAQSPISLEYEPDASSAK